MLDHACQMAECMESLVLMDLWHVVYECIVPGINELLLIVVGFVALAGVSIHV